MSEPVAAPSPKKSSLIIGLLVGVGILLVVALLVPAIADANARARITSCASNMRQIFVMQSTYALQFGGDNREYPTETGSAYWLKLTRTTPPMIGPTELEVLLCPVHDKSAPGTCDYLGPSRPYKALVPADPVGADRKGNHRDGGNIMKKSGDVLELIDADFLSVCDKLSP
jgi:hypothetical protein